MFPQKHKYILGLLYARIHYLLVLGFFCFSFGLIAINSNSSRVQAATSSTLNFQGRLLNSSGSLVPDGLYNLQFKIYDGGTDGGPAGTGEANAGTNLWTESWYDSNGGTAGNDNRVRIVNGYFSVTLGAQTAFPGTINWDQELWLTMNVGGTAQTATPTYDGEMLAPSSKRTKLTAVPYSFVSGRALSVASNNTNAASTNSANISIQSGNAAGATSNSGNITIDVGTATQTAGTIGIGTSNQTGLTIGRSGISTALQGNVSIAGGTNFGVYYRDGSGNVVTTAAGTSGQCFLANTGAGPTWGTCSGSGDIIQGGNAFTAAMTIGTNDNFDFNFETFGATRMTLQADGDLAVDTDTLFVDATNNRVGIGIGASLGAQLHVSGAGGGTSLFRVTDTTATARDVLDIADGGATTFRNQTDSTTAFQIQNAAGTSNTFVANTTNSTVGIGILPSANGNYTLTVGNRARINTQLEIGASEGTAYFNSAGGILFYGLKGGSALNGGTYYLGSNSSNSTLALQENAGQRVLVNGRLAVDTTGDTSNGYNNVTATINADTLQSVDILQVQKQGTNIFTVGSAGAALFKNTADSATAFQIQNALGSQVLVAGTTGLNTLITNGSIENTTITEWASKQNATVTRSTAQQYIGTASISAVLGGTPAINDGIKYTPTPVLSATTYTLTFYIKQTAGTAFGSNLAVGWNNGADTNCTLSPGQSVSPVSTTGWRRYSCTFTGSIGASDHIYWRQSDAPASARTFFIDAVQIEATGTTVSAFQESTIALNGVVSSPFALRNTNDSSTAFQLQRANGVELLNASTLDGNFEITPGPNGNIGKVSVFAAGGTVPAIVLTNNAGNASTRIRLQTSAGGLVFCASTSNICTDEHVLITGGTGAATFKNSTNSTTAFQIQNAAGTSVLTADTTNSKITVVGASNVTGGVSITALATPAQPTVTTVGTAGSTSYSYVVSALNTNGGETVGSTVRTIATGNATIDGTNFNRITWTTVAGAASYNIYRTASAGTPNTTGLIGNVLSAATLQLDDTGLAPTVGTNPITSDYSGNLATNLLTVGSYAQTRVFTTNLPTTVGDYIEVFGWGATPLNNAVALDITINTSGGAGVTSQTKRYILSENYTSTSTGNYRLTPVNTVEQSGYESSSNFELEFNRANSTYPSERLRLVRTVGTIARTATVIVNYTQNHSVAPVKLVAISGTGTSAIGSVYKPISLASRNGAVLIGSSATYDITGAGNATSLTVANTADKVGLILQGFSTQTQNLLVLKDSTNASFLKIDGVGNQDQNGYLSTPYGGIGNYSNLINYSEQFDNGAWTTTGTLTVTPNSTVAPDGTTTADTLAGSTAGATIGNTSGTAPSNNTYTYSVWLKTASGTQAAQLRIDGATSGTGAVTNITVTSGWQRFSISQNVNGFTGNIRPVILPGGTGTGTVIAWGGQLVLGSTPQVYTRTTGTTVAATSGLVSNGTGLFKNGADSTTAFQIQNAAGTSNLFIADTTNSRIGIGGTPANGLLTIGTNTTTSAGGIYFGTDVNLYRVAADELRTDDAFTLGGAGLHLDSTSSTGGNISKRFTSGAGIFNADVLVFNSAGEVVTSTTLRDPKVAGVAVGSSTAGNPQKVVISGYTIVSADTAAVAIGDQLVVSSTVRQVTVDNNATTGIVGYATTAKAGGSSGTISLFVRPVNGQSTPVFRNTTDSTTAFQIQNAAGSQVLVAGTTGLNTLIPNGSIENTTITEWASKQNATVTRSTAQQYIGNASIGAVLGGTPAINDGIKYTPTPVLSATTYTLTFYIKQTAGTAFGSNLAVGWNNGADTNCTLSPTLSTQAVPTTGWARYSCTFTGSIGATDHIYWKQLDAPASARTFFIDAVQIEATATAVSAFQDSTINLNGVLTGPVALRNANDSTSALVIQNAAGTSNILTVDTLNSKVGIGATNPFKTFSINGVGADANGVADLYVTAPSATVGAGITLNATGGGASYSIISTGSGSGAGASNLAIFDVSSVAYRVILESSGQLGVGNFTSGNLPQARLHVSSNAAEPLFRVTDATATAQDVLGIADGGAVTFRNQTDSATAFQILDQGGASLFNIDTSTSAISIGEIATATTTINSANTTIGSSAGSGLLVNNGATRNTALALGNFATGGSIGSAATTVDIYTYITINQTTASQTLTIQDPTSTTAGRFVYITNVGTANFNLSQTSGPTFTVLSGGSLSLIWNGSDWTSAGDGAGGVSAIGAIDGGTYSANGASIIGTVIYLQTASNTQVGLVNTSAQTFAGNKTFNGLITGNLGATILGATINLNASSNFATNINTGTSTGAVTIGNNLAGAIAIQGGSTIDLGANAVAQTITIGNITGATALNLRTGTGNFSIDGVGATTYVIAASATTGTVALGGTSQTGTITLGRSTASNTIDIGNANTATGNTQTIRIGAGTPAGTGQAVITIGNTANASTLTLAAGTGFINLNATQAQFSEVTGTRTLTVQTRTTNVAGTNLTISAGTAGTGGSGVSGGTLTLQGGNAAGTNATGGNVRLQGGNGVGTGVPGYVEIDTPVFTSTTQSFGTSTTVTQSIVDGFSTAVVTATATGLTLTVPDPTTTVSGRVFYLSASSTSNDFTLLANAGGMSISMRTGSTATLVWNGTDWTAAGADSSTSLQQVYNNTATNPVSIVTTSATKTFLIQAGVGFDSETLFQVNNSQGASVFDIDTRNNNLATNGGAENSSTFSTGWFADDVGGGGAPNSTVTRTTTSGEYLSGVAAAKTVISPATADIGVSYQTGALTAGTPYLVSFTAKSSTAWTDLRVSYFRNSGTPDASCTNFNTNTVSTTTWTRITCEFTPTQVGNAQAHFLIYQEASAARTFWIDNLSITPTNATSTARLVVGGITGQGPTLVTLDQQAVAPTTTGLSAYLGSMYYDTFLGTIRCYTTQNGAGGAWGGCGSGTLQQAYSGSTGGTTPEVLLDSTRNGLDIQDANTTIGATQSLLTVRSSATASTLGASLFNVNAGGKVGINLQSTSITPTITYDLSFGEGANRTIGVETRATNAVGRDLTISAGSAGAGAGNFNGGALILQGGAGVGTGTQGLVTIATSAFTSASVQTFASAGTFALTAGNVDAYSSLPVLVTASPVIVTVPDPAQSVVGRLLYISARDTSVDFTLRLNSARTPINIGMKKNSTATLIWNGTDWTAAGASSSTDLQAAYNNTIASAGGAELVLNPSGGAADGFTIRNNGTTPIVGAILEAQTSIGSNLFSVNNNSTEYARNGGAETAGASASTFPASTWSAAPAGGTVSRYTTAGDNIATGAASVFVDTTSIANTGTANTLNTALTPNLKYVVSFAVRHTSSTSSFTTLDAIYSRDGTDTSTTTCSTANTVNYGIWSRVTCSFLAPSTGITASNAMFIRHSDAVEHDFYVDNLSVTVSADVNHAVDGSVDSALGTNWTAFGILDALTRETTIIYDTGGSVAVDTPNATDRGVRNNMSITPTTNTQYLAAVYVRSSNTFNDIRIRYSRDGGTSFVACSDYSTQSVSTSSFTKITCLFTTDGTTATNPDLIIDQPTASDRIFYVDALSVTLNTNNSNNVQIGGGNKGGSVTLFTLDRSSGAPFNGAPIAANNDAYLGSMYYDTASGRIQCYEADGWGACGAAPDNVVNLNPEYAGAVLNGTGVGTMTADICSNDTALSVNSALCATGQAKNYYKWTSPQATVQTYSIYVSYQLPSTFNGFASDDTVQLIARTDSTTNAAVTYEMFKSTGSAVTRCGSGETTVVTTANTWQSVGINGNEATGCSFASTSASNFLLFKINVKANSNANAYVSTLSFTTTGR